MRTIRAKGIWALPILCFSLFLLQGCKTTKPSPVQPDNSNNLVLSLDRTGCYGRCPIYSIKLYENGSVYYEAVRFTDTIGKFCFVLTKQELSALVSAAKGAGLFELEDKYPVSKLVPVDLPSCIITYQEKDRKKRIVDNGNPKPDALTGLEHQIDAIVKSRKLQNCDK